MITKINVLPIISGHFQTLKDRDGKHYIWQDVAGFYVLPALLATYLTFKQVVFIDKYVDIGIISHSIFIPLLVNVLFLIFNIVDRGNVQKLPKRKRLLEQLYNNVAYLILASVFSLVALVVYSVKSIPLWLTCADHWLLYALSIHVFLTALMVIKRIHVLLSKEIVDTATEA